MKGVVEWWLSLWVVSKWVIDCISLVSSRGEGVRGGGGPWV